jgi:hypothetical protein
MPFSPETPIFPLAILESSLPFLVYDICHISIGSIHCMYHVIEIMFCIFSGSLIDVGDSLFYVCS